MSDTKEHKSSFDIKTHHTIGASIFLVIAMSLFGYTDYEWLLVPLIVFWAVYAAADKTPKTFSNMYVAVSALFGAWIVFGHFDALEKQSIERSAERKITRHCYNLLDYYNDEEMEIFCEELNIALNT